MKNFVFPKKIVALSVISGLAIVGISLMKNAMELEDAEQAYYSQWWRWGYDDQPPLYTWLQLFINKLLGVSKISFSFLRALIFSGILMFFYRFANAILKNRSRAISAVLLLVTIPTFIDFTFRRLSHTALLCLVTIFTYVLVYRLLHKKSIVNYALLGLIVGVGLLTKYNYALILMALALSIFWNTELRGIFLNPKILTSFLLVGFLLSPHIIWLFDDSGFIAELQASIFSKTSETSNQGIPIVGPMFALIASFLKLLLPLLFFGLVFYFTKQVELKTRGITNTWLKHLLMAQLLVLILVFIVMGIHKVEARWVLPVLLPFAVLLPNYLRETSIPKFNRIGFGVFLFILLFQVVRTPIEKAARIPSSVHFGFEAIEEKLRTDFPDKEWFLPDVTYAGNVRLLNREREVFALDDFSLPHNKKEGSNSVFVIKHKSEMLKNGMLKDSIMNFGKEKENLFFYLVSD